MRSPFDLPPSLVDEILEYTKLPADDDLLGWFVYDFENGRGFDRERRIETAKRQDLTSLRYIRKHGYEYEYDISCGPHKMNSMIIAILFNKANEGRETWKFLREDGCRFFIKKLPTVISRIDPLRAWLEVE